MDFLYASEKFGDARRMLMLPHTQGEARSITLAFHECTLGLNHVDRSELDDIAGTWVRRLEELMSTDGLPDPDRRGLWAVHAERLSVEERSEFSTIVDELADWFDNQDR